MVQQHGHHFLCYAVDEIDSILIDEARTPLVISGPAPYSSTQYSELQPASLTTSETPKRSLYKTFKPNENAS